MAKAVLQSTGVFPSVYIVNLISSKVLQHSGKFYELGVLEVAIYPDIKITTGNIANPKVSVLFYCHELLHELYHFIYFCCVSIVHMVVWNETLAT